MLFFYGIVTFSKYFRLRIVGNKGCIAHGGQLFAGALNRRHKDTEKVSFRQTFSRYIFS